MAKKQQHEDPQQQQLAVLEPTTIQLVDSPYDPEDAGAGMEGTDSSSFAIPFLIVLQKGSPQVDEASGVAMPGAKAGMFLSSVTGRLYDGATTGLQLVPAAYQRRFIRWGARGTDAAGFKGELTREQVDEMRAKGQVKELDNRLYIPAADGTVNEKKSDRVADVRSHFCVLVHEDGTYESTLLALGSTQIKKSRTLMSALAAINVRAPDGKAFTPATYNTMVRLTTIPEQNDKGTWYGVKFDIIGPVTDPMVKAAAKQLWKSVKTGTAEARYADMNETQTEAAASPGF